VSAFERATWWQLLVDPLASLSLGRWSFGLWDSLSMVAGGLVLVRVGSDLRLFQGALTLWLP
jgi:hypothetical protein